MDVIDNTTSKSGFIQQAKQSTKEKDTGLNSILLNKFRAPKGKSKLPQNSFVEKDSNAIDSFGEIQGIPAKANRLRRLNLIWKDLNTKLTI